VNQEKESRDMNEDGEKYANVRSGVLFPSADAEQSEVLPQLLSNGGGD
jgi:hypothetical protein